MTSFSRRFARRVARRALYPLVERLTVAALLGMRRAGGQVGRARPFESFGGQRVLVVAAHPDDETIGCFATILSHLESGDAVRVLVVTDGSGSRAGGLGPGEMVRRRSFEIREVARMMPGTDLVSLGLVEGRWDAGELAAALERQLTELMPDVMYAPSCVDFHPEHLKVARVCASALDKLPGHTRPIVRVYEMQVPLGLELANRYTPLGHRHKAKGRAIAAYRSQRGALDLWRREARYLGALLDTPGGAEAFWELPACAYVRVIAGGGWDWRTTPFKSLSGRPLGDLAAYLKGRNARLRLRSLAVEATMGYRRWTMDDGRWILHKGRQGMRVSWGSSMLHRPSSIVHRPSSIPHRPSSIPHRPSSIVHRPLPWRRVLRRAARWGLSLRWRIRPPNYSRTYRVRVNGFDLVVLPTVFHPTWHFTSRFFAEECERLLGSEVRGPLRGGKPVDSVLEIGTGTGLVALSAARCATRVVATDINPLAVECARRNAEANGLAQKVQVLEGDMFVPVAGRRFDVILCNPPYFKGSPRSTVELAYMGGENLEWVGRLAAQARDYLAEDGALFCVFGDAGDVTSLVEIFRREGWSSECVARRALITEQLSIWKFT